MAEPISLAFVDDDRLCTYLAGELFSRDPAFRFCGTASSGDEAEVLLRRTRPRVVVIDWLLGEMDGSTLIAGLAPELPDTRWILTSGFICHELMLAADRVGAAGVIDKLQFSGQDLRTAIRAVARGEEYFCPVSRAMMREVFAEQSRLRIGRRQCEVLRLVAAHHSRAEVAARLGISRAMVTKHLGIIAEKLALDGRPSLSVLVPMARKAGLLPRLPTRAVPRLQPSDLFARAEM